MNIIVDDDIDTDGIILLMMSMMMIIVLLFHNIQVLKEQVEIKYTNRILLDVGLCITFYDFIEVGDPYLYPSEGSSIQVVRFRMVVFRPFIGESIVGKVTKSSKEGLHLSVDFFDEIFVPSSLLQSPSVYNPSTGLWVWKYGENQDMDFEMGLGDEVSTCRSLTIPYHTMHR